MDWGLTYPGGEPKRALLSGTEHVSKVLAECPTYLGGGFERALAQACGSASSFGVRPGPLVLLDSRSEPRRSRRLHRTHACEDAGPAPSRPADRRFFGRYIRSFRRRRTMGRGSSIGRCCARRLNGPLRVERRRWLSSRLPPSDAKHHRQEGSQGQASKHHQNLEADEVAEHSVGEPVLLHLVEKPSEAVEIQDR